MKAFDDSAYTESPTDAEPIRRDELPLVLGRSEAHPSIGFGTTPKPNRDGDLYPIK